MRSILALVLLFFSTIYSSVAEASDAPLKYEMRGVWLTTNYGLDWPTKPASDIEGERRQQRELLGMLDQLKEVGVNTIFLQVRGRGTVIYPSEVEPMSPDFAVSGYTLTYDPLEFAITEAKRRGISLHAWLAVIPIGNERFLRTLPKHAYGTKHRKDCVIYRGGVYMDPASPQTAKHMRRVVAELLQNYELAGIHLDFMRYPDDARGFPDTKAFKAKGRGQTLANWRRANIEQIVGEISKEIDLHSPDVMHSVAVLAAYRELPGRNHGWTSLNEGYQDPVSWAEKGYIDFVVPMLYNRGERFVPYVQDWAEVMSVPVMMGVGAFRVLPNEGRWHPNEVIEQIDHLHRHKGIGGSVLFRTKQVVERSRGLWQPLKERWGSSATFPISRAVIVSDTLDLKMMVEGTSEGLRVSWYGSPHHNYALYMTVDGSMPDLEKDLYLMTRRQSVTIPWIELRYGDLLTIRVGAYDMTTGKEWIESEPALYYYSIFEK